MTMAPEAYSLFAGLPFSLNPFEWSSLGYVTVIAILLGFHQLVPRGGPWFQRLGREILLIAPAIFIYFAVRGVAVAREEDAIRNADLIIDFQARLGIFHEPTLQAWILQSDFMVRTMNWIYIWGHWPVVVGTLVWLIIRRPNTFSIYRNAFLISGLLAMLIFVTYPVAPPRLMPEMDVVDTVTEQSSSYRVLQPPALTNPYAAMPSLHFGWNLLMGIAIIRETRARPVRFFGYIMPVAMFCGIVLTANHYLVDGVVGGMLVVTSLWASISVLKWRGFDVWDNPEFSELTTVPPVDPSRPERHGLLDLPKPITIAHRAANDLAYARKAELARVNVIEADIWLYQNRLEVRHSKTIGPLPLRWDRWWIRFWPEPDLTLDQLLGAVSQDTVIMFDLKGSHPDLPRRLMDTIRTARPGTQIVVCSQTWPYLERLKHEPDVSVVYSIGSTRQLGRAWEMLEREGYDAVSIDCRLLTEETTRQLLERVPVVVTWPINDQDTLNRVLGFGVTGVISDSLELLEEIEQRRSADRV
jgi:glycerophosphoryl diester phosphodiesterase